MNILPTSIIFFLLTTAGSALASTVTYDCAVTSGSSPTNCSIGESQFLTTVTDDGTGTTFSFQNLGNSMSVITQIYFDDTALSLLDFNTVAVDDKDLGPLNNMGVDFTNGSDPAVANPGAMPGEVDFDESFAIGRAKQGGVGRGINNLDPLSSPADLIWETLEISADYFGNGNFSLLTAALDSGAFQIGLHVQSFPDGGSEWFTSTTTTVVPVPAAFWLFGTALIGLIGISRRRIN